MLKRVKGSRTLLRFMKDGKRDWIGHTVGKNELLIMVSEETVEGENKRNRDY